MKLRCDEPKSVERSSLWKSETARALSQEMLPECEDRQQRGQEIARMMKLNRVISFDFNGPTAQIMEGLPVVNTIM
jgi:hypothetical protein